MDHDTNKQRQEVALFRFGVISELVSSRLESGELTDLIYHKSEQHWDIPGSDRTRISAATIRRWLRLYERSGRELASLAPAPRCDRGHSRRVDEETCTALIRLRKENPSLPVYRLVEQLSDKQLLASGEQFSLSTAYRILKRESLNTSALRTGKPVDRRRYEAEFPNDIWQSDVMHGPSVTITGKRRKAYLIAVLDDHSRLIPHGEFFISERLDCWLQAFRQALLTRGLPRKLYVDNGPAFRSRQLERICASLGIALIHSRPYTPQGRGKIERFFRTVRTRFLPGIGDGALTLDELNERFSEWLERDYHHRTHSVTGMTPFNRFAAHLEMIRAAPVDLDDHFRTEVRRRVAKDRVVTIDGKLFEAPTQLIGEQVALLFHKEQPQRVEVFYKGRSYGLLRPLDPVINTRVARGFDADEQPPYEKRSWRQGLLPLSSSSSRETS